MRDNHYLIAEGYTPKQREQFERERIAVIVLCADQPRTMQFLAFRLGVYQAKRIVTELRLDGYLERVLVTKTQEVAYRFRADSISKQAFFMGS